MTPELVVASYNVHRCYGSDGRRRPERVAWVLRDLGADVTALQEVDSQLPDAGIDQLAFLASAVGATPIAGPTLVLHRGSYGNALLVRRPVLAVRRHDLSVRGSEPRGALDVDLDIDGTLVRIVAIHLGLRRAERHQQVAMLLHLLAGPRRPTVLLGDVNEWLPGAKARRWLHHRFGRTASGPTFPARWPVLVLDRVWVDPRAALLEISVHITPTSRAASDHLPVRARIDPKRLPLLAREPSG